jgi:hypothetical protein
LRVSFHISLFTLFFHDVLRNSVHQLSHGVLGLDHLTADKGELKSSSQYTVAISSGTAL